MSLFGAMNTAISGLSAQSSAFANISDNVANSQTVGFKRIDTAFIDYLTSSTAHTNSPGAVVARPDYRNSLQGAIAQTDNPLALGVVGQGFFAVSRAESGLGDTISFAPQKFFTRAGDFAMDRSGYLVNSANDHLNGWSVDAATSTVDRSSAAPIRVTQTAYNPLPTTRVNLSANLPATPTAGSAVSAQVNVYDTLGTSHVVTLDWTQTAASDWMVAVDVPDDITTATRGSARVAFGPTISGNPVPPGTVGLIDTATGSITAGTYTIDTPASLSFTTDFGNGPQTIALNLGTYGQSTGVTQYAGTSFALHTLSQNGVPPGAFSSVAITQDGDVQVSYDNGQSRTIARVPLVTFNDPDALQRHDGQAFSATLGSGDPLTQDAGVNGAGGLVTSAVENSNVDIAHEFTKLIVAQRAYSANAKMVTTADELLQQTIDMKR